MMTGYAACAMTPRSKWALMKMEWELPTEQNTLFWEFTKEIRSVLLLLR